MAKKTGETPTVTDQLRDAIQSSGQSLNQIGKASGVDATRLSRFVRGERDLTGQAIDKICQVLGLGLAKRRTKPTPPKAEEQN